MLNETTTNMRKRLPGTSATILAMISARRPSIIICMKNNASTSINTNTLNRSMKNIVEVVMLAGVEVFTFKVLNDLV